MAQHLTASMRVVRAHQHRPSVTIAETVKAVKEAAFLVGIGAAGPETLALVAKLEKACGCSVAVLARHAEDWDE